MNFQKSQRGNNEYRIANGTLSQRWVTAYNVLVKVGKVIICPGDIICGDTGGRLVISRGIAMDVLSRAEEICLNDKTIRKRDDGGMTARDIVRGGGYF